MFDPDLPALSDLAPPPGCPRWGGRAGAPASAPKPRSAQNSNKKSRGVRAGGARPAALDCFTIISVNSGLSPRGRGRTAGGSPEPRMRPAGDPCQARSLPAAARRGGGEGRGKGDGGRGRWGGKAGATPPSARTPNQHPYRSAEPCARCPPAEVARRGHLPGAQRVEKRPEKLPVAAGAAGAELRVSGEGNASVSRLALASQPPGSALQGAEDPALRSQQRARGKRPRWLLGELAPSGAGAWRGHSSSPHRRDHRPPKESSRQGPSPKGSSNSPPRISPGHGTPPPLPPDKPFFSSRLSSGRAPSGTGSIVRMVPIRLSRLPRGRAGSERGCCCSSRSHCSPRRGSAGRARAPCPAPRGAGVTARRSEGRSAGVTGGAPKGRTCQAPRPELRKTREASKWPELLEGGKKSGVFGRLPPLCA